MNIRVEKNIDINELLKELEEKSQRKEPGMIGYEVTVSKQLLQDAHDVILSLLKESNLSQTTLGNNNPKDDSVVRPKFYWGMNGKVQRIIY